MPAHIAHAHTFFQTLGKVVKTVKGVIRKVYEVGMGAVNKLMAKFTQMTGRRRLLAESKESMKAAIAKAVNAVKNGASDFWKSKLDQMMMMMMMIMVVAMMIMMMTVMMMTTTMTTTTMMMTKWQ